MESLNLAIMQAYSLFRSQSHLAFQELGLTDGQPKILRYLLGNNGILQKDLSKHCNVTPATMTSLLQNMQAQNLIEKKEIRTSGGKRGYLIFLTPHGHSLALQVAELLEDVEQLSLKGFSDLERENLLLLLSRVCSNLQA